MIKKLTMIFAGLLLSTGMALAQMQVTGTVVSQDDNQPIIGATVQVPGTQVGAVTNVDGKFSLTVPAGHKTLRITYVGMEPLEVSARPNMRIVLTSDANALDEVMVVAYGTQKKSSFTGSATMVGDEELSKHTVTNVQEALAGSVPGLQIRGSSGAPGSSGGAITIRGINSMYSAVDPLIIVDGAPYTASLSNIPPSDIESVSVLKDASSAALYGARGAGGVIIITTKKGKSREAQITVDMKWGANSRAIQEYDLIKDPGKYYEAFYSQFYNYQFYGQGASAVDANAWANNQMMNNLGYNVYTVPDGEQLIGLNGKLNPNATLGRAYQWNGETYYMIPDDWNDIAYHTAFRQEYTVSANAAHDRGSYYVSLNHLNEDGVIEYSGYRRTTARLKADYQLKKWLKFGANVNYVHSDTKSNPNLSSSDGGSVNLSVYTSRIAPIYPVYVRVLDPVTNQPVIRTDAEGNPQYDYGVASWNYGVQRGFLATGNPLGANRYNNVYSIGNQLTASGTVDVLITDNLKFTNASTVIWGETTASDYENGIIGPKAGVNGEITKVQSNTLRQNHVQTLNYTNTWNQHSLTAMLGHEWYDTKTRYLGASRTGGFSPEIPELSAFATMSGSSSYTSEYNVEGFFGNVLYNYAEKYFGSASYRRDATSMFDKDHRWGDFWSIGAAWIISKENFMESTSSWLDQLKVKASIGQQGNDNTSSWAYTDTYSLTKASDTSMAPSFRLIGNPEITWETLTNFNAGVEFSLWKGRLNGGLDYYYRKTSDLLFWLSIPESAGTRGYYGNMGSIRNTGWELTLTGTPIKTKDFEWIVSANISTNSAKILSLPEAKVAENGGFYEGGYWYENDGDMYNYMNFAYAGVNEQGEALYYYDADLSTLGGNATNDISVPGKQKSGTTTKIGEASRYAHGSILPKAFGGFSTTVRWKDFDASVSFDYQLGGKIYDSQYAGYMSNVVSSGGDTGSALHKDILNSWTPNNTSSNIPRFQFGDQYTNYSSDRFLTNAKYLNFQSFTLGYTLPKALTSKISVASIRIYASGENLIFWSARKGLDPRQSYSETSTYSRYAPVRTINGGIQVTF